MKSGKNSIRTSNFWHSNSPLTSHRVRNILSNPASAQKLVSAVRESRGGMAAKPGEKASKGVFTIVHKD